MSAVEHKAMVESLKNNGVFKLKDDKTGKELELEFVDTHQPVRQLDDGHYFACTDFRVVGTKNEIYDIDFWVSDKDGKMTVDQTKVHKVPERIHVTYKDVDLHDADGNLISFGKCEAHFVSVRQI